MDVPWKSCTSGGQSCSDSSCRAADALANFPVSLLRQVIKNSRDSYEEVRSEPQVVLTCRHLPPNIQTKDAQTIMAITAPLDMEIELVSAPEAPASESPELLPAELPTSPGAGPLPGCWGDEVASTEYNEETALADICGVRDMELVVVGAEDCEEESCARDM